VERENEYNDSSDPARCAVTHPRLFGKQKLPAGPPPPPPRPCLLRNSPPLKPISPSLPPFLLRLSQVALSLQEPRMYGYTGGRSKYLGSH
jgi:hypothetical protein